MPPADVERYGIVLLAAGKSSRLGKPKQLLIFEDTTLIKRAAKTALEITNKTVVVTGALQEKVEEELNGLPVHIKYNKDYHEGIASSIRTGLTFLIKNFGELKGAIFMVCDQPYLSSWLISQLIQKAAETNSTIVAASYAGTIGTPVLFEKNFFPMLLELKGDNGAKKLIKENLNQVTTVNFSQGEIDIDTATDYDLISGKS